MKVPTSHNYSWPIRGFLCEIEAHLEMAAHSDNPRAPEAVGKLLETFVNKAQHLDYVLRKEMRRAGAAS